MTCEARRQLAWEDGLHAVEKYGEGEQHGEIVHGGEHDLAEREEVPWR